MRNVFNYDVQAGVTGVSDSFVVAPGRDVNVGCVLTAGTPAVGARVQVTLDDPDRIAAGTANWLNSPLGSRIISGSENVLHPVTGVRLSVTDGTWTFQVRQG